MNRALVTCDAESQALAYEELVRAGCANLPGTWLDTGDAVQGSILLLDSQLAFAEFSERLATYGSIFVRHIAPVDAEIELKGAEPYIDAILETAPDLAGRIDPGLSFSVQSRILGEGKLSFRKVVLNERLSDDLARRTGSMMDCREPHQVVSILCTPSRAFVGLSLSAQNRSAWPGGRHRFKREDDQISRAEFKLLEAVSVFELRLPKKGFALDMGASPGGWTRVLAESGLKVDAVDPAELDERLRVNKRVKHFRRRMQEFSPQGRRYAAIVNDLKMDARDSIELMNRFSEFLDPGRIAIMTLKMPKFGSSTGDANRALDMIRVDLKLLSQCYQVIGARQLYHNRSEVTVALRR